MIALWLTVVLIVFAATWGIGGILVTFSKKKAKLAPISNYLPILGNLTIVAFTILLWIRLDRPPMRTIAETRLWYSVFISWITWLIFFHTKEILVYWLGFIMTFVFLLTDTIHPEYQSKALMPALQSPWFIPHVVVYMIAYAVLGIAWLSSIIGIFSKQSTENIISVTIKLAYIGFGLLTLGMLMGALWAKIAWGNYWSWDPKETWALLTWLFYLLAIHLHYAYPKKKKLLLWLFTLSFIVLLITWFGIRYIAPASPSVHIYAQ